jgi:ATP phosphoribosyltransferase
MISEGRLHLAVQKSGRLSELSRSLLRDAGLRIQNGKNDLAARVENFPIDLMFVRDDDIPTFVSDGVCEFGIVGRNVLEEFALGEAEPSFEVAPARVCGPS